MNKTWWGGVVRLTVEQVRVAVALADRSAPHSRYFGPTVSHPAIPANTLP